MKPSIDTIIPQGIENIKRIVVVMFENRSFDHLFGDFPGANGLFDQDGNFKEECYNLQNPLSPPSDLPPKNPKVFPSPVAPDCPLEHDFTHDFGDGMMPDLFGPVFTINGEPPFPWNANATYTSGYTQAGLVGQMHSLPVTYPATNSGFFTTYNTCQQQGRSVMSYFEKGTLKVLHKLAAEFVLCDNWFCDMPGHTLPNRAFFHCGTTCGPNGTTQGIDDSDGGLVAAPAIFDLIKNQGSDQDRPTWKMYAPVDDSDKLGQLDTRFLNANLQSYKGVAITDFSEDCNNGTLPFYSFIMCWTPCTTSYTGTSMHPNSMMQGGENLLAAIYNTLHNSRYWEDTLLMVTFDENGGMYDHVFPPTTTPPYQGAEPATQSTQGCCGNNWTLDSTFDFSLLGPRVPALLISPWLSKGIDSTPYQNTSVLRFVIDKMNAEYGEDVSYLTARDAGAPSLNSAFSQFGRSNRRTDCPSWIEPYAKLPCKDPSTGSDAIPYSEGKLTRWSPPVGSDIAAPPPYINEVMNMYISQLPGHPDSGRKITRQFTNNATVAQYIAEREQAADLYYQAEKDSNDNRLVSFSSTEAG